MKEQAISELPRKEPLEDPPRLTYRRRFQGRLLAYLIAFSFACSLTAGGIYYSRQVKFVEADQARRGRTLLSNLAGQSELGAYSGDPSFLVVPARRAFSEQDVCFAAVYDISGNILTRMTKPGFPVDLRLPPHLLHRIRLASSASIIQHPHPLYNDLLAPIATVSGDVEQGLFGSLAARAKPTIIGAARLGLSRKPSQDRLDEVLGWGILLAAIVLCMGVLLALLLARHISRPILALAHAADEVSGGRLGFQLDLKRQDELGLLAESFNRMSARLKETVESLAHLNRNLESEVARRTEEVRESRDFAQLLIAPLQLQSLLDRALASLMTHAGAVAGAVYLRQGEGGLELLVSHGALAAAFQGEQGEPPPLLQPAMEAVSPLVSGPLAETFPLRSDHPEIQAMVWVPVRYQNKSEAVVVLGLPCEPEKDIAFLAQAGSQLAITVANARAFASIERLARELERRNTALMAQRDQLQEVNRLKSEFLANVSHELRTPLNAILGYTEMMLEGILGEVTAEQQDSLQGLHDNARSLLELINQFLDLSKVEAGLMKAAVRQVDLKQMLRDVVEKTVPLTRDRPYQVEAVLPERAVLARTDIVKVRQIMVNLLSNAIKFTEQGSVVVSVEIEDASGDIFIKVKDTGIGIRPEHLDVIFDAFRQVDGSTTRLHGGTGLGLAISKQLAGLLGGDILVQSTYGQGSRFTLVLPRAWLKEVQAEEALPEVTVTVSGDAHAAEPTR